MIVERFQPEHLARMPLQPAQESARVALADPEYLAAITSGPAATLLAADGAPVAAGGIVEFEDGSLLWSFLARDAGRNMVAVVRAARRLVEVAKRPTYATAACEFAAGGRMLELLGFERLPDPVSDVDAGGGLNFVYVRR